MAVGQDSEPWTFHKCWHSPTVFWIAFLLAALWFLTKVLEAVNAYMAASRSY
jgi:hypothetical protein